eukprot:g2093.t1
MEDLMAMGFSGEDAGRALAAAEGNPERAVEFLLSGHIPEPPQQNAQPQTPEEKGAQWLRLLRAGLRLLDVEAPKPDFDDFEFESEEQLRSGGFVARLAESTSPLQIWPSYGTVCSVCRAQSQRQDGGAAAVTAVVSATEGGDSREQDGSSGDDGGGSGGDGGGGGGGGGGDGGGGSGSDGGSNSGSSSGSQNAVGHKWTVLPGEVFEVDEIRGLPPLQHAAIEASGMAAGEPAAAAVAATTAAAETDNDADSREPKALRLADGRGDELFCCLVHLPTQVCQDAEGRGGKGDIPAKPGSQREGAATKAKHGKDASTTGKAVARAARAAEAAAATGSGNGSDEDEDMDEHDGEHDVDGDDEEEDEERERQGTGEQHRLDYDMADVPYALGLEEEDEEEEDAEESMARQMMSASALLA